MGVAYGLEKQEGLLADKLLGINYCYSSISPYNIPFSFLTSPLMHNSLRPLDDPI